MWRLLVMVVVAGLAFGACGESEVKVSDPTPAPTLESPADELMRRADSFEQTEFQAIYEMLAEFDGGVIEGTFTWYQKKGSVRGDFSGRLGDQNSDFVLIPGPGYPSESFHYVCHVDKETCVESRPKSEESAYMDGQYPAVLGAILISAEEFGEAFLVETTSRQQIEGQETVCFIAPSAVNESFESGEVCVTDDGIVLRMSQESVNGNTFSLHAIEFSRDVDDEVFELPYELIRTSTPEVRGTPAPPATIRLVHITPAPQE